MEYIYNKYLNPIPVYNKSIRFKRKANKVNYLAYMDNLIIKAILKSLGSSTYKDTIVFLDRISNNSWNKVILPIISGDITILYIIVLWMNRFL
jgi:hypothetical protein